MRLEGKVAIVTGGGRGIGRGIAHAFAREGAKVVIAARTQEQLDNVVGEINEAGGTVAAIATDVSVAKDLRCMVDFTIERFGAVNVLVNNAGIGWWGYHIDDDGVEESYDNLMATNLRSVFMGCHFAVPHMKKAGGGSIISIGSVHGWATHPLGSAYAASKGGMVAGTRGLALELAPHMIRVNVISPGAIQLRLPEEIVRERLGEEHVKVFVERFADVFDAQRKAAQAMPVIGRPEDIAQCAVYLASDESRFVTGINITVDGGMTARLGEGMPLGPEMQERQREMHAWFEETRARKHQEQG
jgi:NAD(P)-dependent dehydrogenase (short-subunit alcohol dehydrogenase family)